MFKFSRKLFTQFNLTNELHSKLNRGLSLVVRGNCMSPSIHLPFENYLMQHCKAPVCFVRTNPKSVVVGTHQLIQAECNLENIRKDNIDLVRRQTGGGAVYLDEGNCMFGVMGPIDHLTKKDTHDIMIQAINKIFDVSAEFTGKNDIKVGSHKVAGLAYARKSSKLLAHACILVDSDLIKHSKYLTPHQKKITSHGVSSMDQRVINLIKYLNPKDVNWINLMSHFSETLTNEFSRKFGPQDNCLEVTDQEILTIPEVFEEHKKYKTSDYLLRGVKNYQLVISEKFPFGFVELYLQIDNSRDPVKIIDFTINTDAVDLQVPELVHEAIRNYNDNNHMTTIDSSDIETILTHWISKEMIYHKIIKNISSG